MWFRRRKVILIATGNIVGLTVILLGAKLLYQATVVPEVPKPETAAVPEVVEFLASDHMQRLSKTTRRDYLRRVERMYRQPERRRRFVEHLDKLRPFQIQRLRNNVFAAVKDQVVEDSRDYATLKSRKAKRAFIQKKIEEAENIQRILRGEDVKASRGSRGKRKVDLARRQKLTAELPSTPAEAYGTFLEKTNPSDRARVETYVNDFQQEYEKWRSRSKRVKHTRK